MSLYSFNGNEPAPLPVKIHLTEEQTESGLRETRTSLDRLDIEELNSYGFTGPYEVPEHDPITKRITWDSENLQYVVSDYDDAEIDANVRTNAKIKFEENQEKFVNELITSEIYAEVRCQATENLLKNTIATEFLTIINKLKLDPSQSKNTFSEIQQYIDIIMKVFTLTEDHLSELKDILTNTFVDPYLHVSDPEFIESHVYDLRTNMLIQNRVTDSSEYDGPPPPSES